MQEWFARIPSLELAEPWWLLLLPVLLLAAWFKERHERRGKGPAILFPGLESLRDLGFGAGRILRLLPQWLRWSALFLSVIALAGPHLLYRQTEAEAKGIDVMLVLDISDSMLQKDFAGESRLDAAKDVARNFVLNRSNDRIGLVVFRGKGYTQCPLTIDHDVLAMLIDRLTPAVIQDEGTAIGTAILIAVNRLKASESSNKAIILVTDGENNTGEVGPATAAGFALQSGIRIYAINAGVISQGNRLDLSGEKGNHAEMDEESLRGIVRTTGGRYFSVKDPAAFAETMKAIDRLEKKRTSGAIMEHRSGLFTRLVLTVLALFFLEIILSNTRLLRIP
ncbi:MAG: VWA domain-containing protein [Chlorobium sp.]|jgi:Ca-activated chloride channel family protein|nr:MAG: VWA domain-containing protein [Chlorobium sp.]